jgi:hypothetical protein
MKGTSVSAVILVAVLSALVGCGTNGGGGGNGGTALTQAQAQLVGASISNDMSNALSSALLSPAVGLDISSRDHIRAGLQRKSKASTATRPDTVTCGTSTCTISGTYTCPDSGSIEVSGGVSATSNSVGGKITETPSNCSDGTADISGDPNITVGLQGSDNGISTSVSVTIDGGVSFSPVQAGQFPSGSCTCNLTVSGTVNDGSGTVTACSVSGSVCGQNINANCTNVP